MFSNYSLGNKKRNIILLLVALVVIVAVVAMLYIRSKYSHRLEFKGYQIIFGEEIAIGQGERITIKDEAIECSNGNDIDRSPIYSHQKKDFAILVPMFSVVQPYENEAPKRLLPFTEITKNQNMYIMKRGSNTSVLERCFMYDGADIYFFIRDTVVSIDAEPYALSPFSFVYAPYNQAGYIYDYASGTTTLIPQGSKVTAVFDYYYTIYLDTDRLESKDGGIILHQNVEELKKYK